MNWWLNTETKRPVPVVHQNVWCPDHFGRKPNGFHSSILSLIPTQLVIFPFLVRNTQERHMHLEEQLYIARIGFRKQSRSEPDSTLWEQFKKNPKLKKKKIRNVTPLPKVPSLSIESCDSQYRHQWRHNMLYRRHAMTSCIPVVHENVGRPDHTGRQANTLDTTILGDIPSKLIIVPQLQETIIKSHLTLKIISLVLVCQKWSLPSFVRGRWEFSPKKANKRDHVLSNFVENCSKTVN